MVQIDNIIAALFRRASDASPDVRAAVCQSLSILLNIRPDKILPQMSNVAEYMIYSAQDQDESVALEASEFWLTFGEDPSMVDQLRPFLPQVGPLLLNGMVYSQSDLDWLGGDDEEDENVPDKAEDIKPRFYGKTHNQEHVENSGPKAAPAPKAEDEDDDSDYADDDYDEDDEDDLQGEWNLRKCSAAALDIMAVSFGDEMLTVLLPHLRDKLFSTDWLQKESSILALGAIAEGKQNIVRLGVSAD
jgi:transportin-1